MSTIGIEQVVSPRLSAINTILQYVRRGKVLSAISIKGEAGEVMEALALPTSDIVSKTAEENILSQRFHCGRHHSSRGDHHSHRREY
jgi:Trk K+ transport system NAD-binding subunit